MRTNLGLLEPVMFLLAQVRAKEATVMRGDKVSRIGWLIYGLGGIIGCRVDGYYVFPDASPTQAPWVRQLGGEEFDGGRSIALDGDNNLIAVGGFRRTITAGPELTSSGEDDIFAVKLDASTGDVIWAR